VNWDVKEKLNVKADALSRAEILNVETITSDLMTAQNNDIIIKALIKDPTKDYFVENKILFRKSNTRQRIVIPESMKTTIFKLCHDDMSGGHLGIKKTWPKIRDRYYWKNMYSDTEKWIKVSTKCAQRKTPKQVTKIGLNPINEATFPFEMSNFVWTTGNSQQK
jgi:hypothetical protein